MTRHSKRQLVQAGGSLTGWILAQLYDKKDSVPFTIIGGLCGFILAAELIPDEPRKQLSGVRKRSKK